MRNLLFLLMFLVVTPAVGDTLPFFRNNRDTNAANVPYTAAVGASWQDPDPDDVADALDKVAARLLLVETSVPAGEVTYTPAVLADWDANADPGDLDDALDQLAERVDDNEIAIAAVSPPTYVRRITVAVGAEVADHRTFTVTIKDSAGATVAGADTLRIGFYNDETTASLANSAVWPVADVGSGAIGTTLGGGWQLFMATTAAGVLELDVNDINGASSTTIWAYVEIRHDGTVGLTSAPVLVPVAFDGA